LPLQGIEGASETSSSVVQGDGRQQQIQLEGPKGPSQAASEEGPERPSKSAVEKPKCAPGPKIFLSLLKLAVIFQPLCTFGHFLTLQLPAAKNGPLNRQLHHQKVRLSPGEAFAKMKRNQGDLVPLLQHIRQQYPMVRP